MLVSLLGSIKLFKTTLNANDKFYLFISISFVLLIISMVFSKNMLGANYPETRKTILYLPFVGFLPVFYLHYYVDKNIRKILSSGLIVLLVTLFVTSVKINSTLEWWYDWDTKNIYQMIRNDSKSPDDTVGSHWMFNPTLDFYNQYIYKNSVNIIDYNKNIDTSLQYNYFVCFRSELELLQHKYDIIYENLSGILLLKKKA